MTMQTIGWAIIHSLWEGGIIALVSAGLFELTRRARPSIRYGIGLGALALMVILPVATAIRMPNAKSGTMVSPIEASPGNLDSRPDATTAGPNTIAPVNGAGVPTRTIPPAPSPSTASDREASANTALRFLDTSGATRYIEAALPLLVLAWIIGLLVSSLKLIGGLARTRRITRDGVSTPPDGVIHRVAQLCERLQISRAVRSLQSTNVDVPLVVGILRPALVIPASLVTGLTPLQLDMLITHELAHIRRHDFVVNLVQTVIETLLFYHPAVRWLSERVREERENCCDDVALIISQGDAAEYTRTLLVLEESRTRGFGLAAAATGGSLLRRAQRLITGQTARVELGPRWFAGVVTIGAALLTGREAMGGIQASFVPVEAVAGDTTEHQDKIPDPSKAAPGPVTKAPSGGSLRERWSWAEQRGSGSYWIGYLVAGDEEGKLRYYASDIPLRINSSLTMRGRLQLGHEEDVSGFTFYGVPLQPIFGTHSPNSLAIFIQISEAGRRQRVERARVTSFAFPVYFDRKPVIWLDSAGDAESVALIGSLLSSARDENTRRDLVATLGMHQSPNAVVPPLVKLLESRESEGVRREAADWLGKQPDSRAVSALSRAARTDRSSGVRKEAIETFAHMKAAGATDSLIALAGSLGDHDLRRTAIESLGNRPDDRAFDYLTRIVSDPRQGSLRNDAVEALADMPDARGMRRVIEIARTAQDPDVRRVAVESIAHSDPPSRALDVLLEIVRSDPDESVRAEAIETIAEIHDARSVTILSDIANRDPSPRLQLEAIEALGGTADPKAALAALRSIARSHPRFDARKKALETLADFHDDAGAIDVVLETARSAGDTELRYAAFDALGESRNPRALASLASIARGREPADVRKKALEAHAEYAPAAEGLALLKSVMTSDPSADIRLRAVELLEELDDDAGLPTLREIARSSSDRVLRTRAAEILDDR